MFRMEVASCVRDEVQRPKAHGLPVMKVGIGLFTAQEECVELTACQRSIDTKDSQRHLGPLGAHVLWSDVPMEREKVSVEE
jgi:hypothetical protein